MELSVCVMGSEAQLMLCTKGNQKSVRKYMQENLLRMSHYHCAKALTLTRMVSPFVDLETGSQIPSAQGCETKSVCCPPSTGVPYDHNMVSILRIVMGDCVAYPIACVLLLLFELQWELSLQLCSSNCFWIRLPWSSCWHLCYVLSSPWIVQIKDNNTSSCSCLCQALSGYGLLSMIGVLVVTPVGIQLAVWRWYRLVEVSVLK